MRESQRKNQGCKKRKGTRQKDEHASYNTGSATGDFHRRNDNLARISVTGILDRVAEDADTVRHLAHFPYFVSINEIARVCDQLLATSDLNTISTSKKQRVTHRERNTPLPLTRLQ